MAKGRLFHGWVNVAVLFFSYATVVASISYAFGVVVAEMADSFAMTMALATGAYTGYTLIHALTAPLAGRMVDRFGAKKCMLFGHTLMMTGCLILGLFARSVWVYYLFWIVFIGFGMRFGTLLPSQVNISKWFFHYRGLAMAILLAAGGIGGYIFTPVCTAVNRAWSWRGVWLMIAGLVAVNLLLIALLLRESPDPDREAVDGGAVPKRAVSGAAAKTLEPWRLHEALRQPAFYLLVFLYFASSYELSVVSSQGINHLALQGIDRAQAAGAVGLFALINTFGRILVGMFGERFELRRLVGLGALLSLAGFLLIWHAATLFTAYAALVLLGLGYGILMVSPQNLLLDYFGTHDYAKINGAYSLIAGVLASAPAVLIGWFYDLNGNYSFAWLLGILLMAGALLSALVIRQPRYVQSPVKNIHPASI